MVITNYMNTSRDFSRAGLSDRYRSPSLCVSRDFIPCLLKTDRPGRLLKDGLPVDERGYPRSLGAAWASPSLWPPPFPSRNSGGRSVEMSCSWVCWSRGADGGRERRARGRAPASSTPLSFSILGSDSANHYLPNMSFCLFTYLLKHLQAYFQKRALNIQQT
jgi:hypothetical protein